MPSTPPPDTTLRPDRIIATVDELSHRIEERFPGSGLGRVCQDLLAIARQAETRSVWIGRPILALRAGILALALLILAGLGATLFGLKFPVKPLNLLEFIQVLEAGINDVVFLGAAIFFLVTLEARLKRSRALAALHELRSVAHVIDMHQLTKDPDRVLSKLRMTASSPQEKMTLPELRRYLDYCSELLSLCGKIAALYVQHFDDSVAIAAATDIESLTTGLSRKIWQKIMILHRAS